MIFVSLRTFVFIKLFASTNPRVTVCNREDGGLLILEDDVAEINAFLYSKNCEEIATGLVYHR